MIGVKVPATSANMGAGFDTLGIALNLYSRLEIEERESGLEIITVNGTHVADDKTNLVYRAMEKVFNTVGYTPKGLYIKQDSDIPMTRGLGSSSGCIIGGMLGANVICKHALSYGEILDLAAQMEGHPDNVGPALYGGFCVSVKDGEHTYVKSMKLRDKLRFAVMIPDFFVATKKSRGVLPDEINIKTAAHNIARASLFQAALISRDYDLLKCGVDDKMHQPYRKNYIDGFDEIFAKTYELGSKATYLSGSGPTLVSVLTGNGSGFKNEMQRFFSDNSHQWRCLMLECDNVGSVVRIDR